MELNTVRIAIAIFVLLSILAETIFFVEEKTCVVINQFGKFKRICEPGINYKYPLFEQKAGLVNLRLQQLQVHVETKTADNVFVHLTVAVQYKIVSDKIYEAFYTLEEA